MVYRIDIQHYLTHAIDHFTREELTHMQYAIISAKISNGGKCQNMAKVNHLYPDPDIISTYAEYRDKDMMEKMYLELLNTKKRKGEEITFAENAVYDYILQPLLNNHDIVIICDRSEDDYIDVLCKWLKKKWKIEVIDLNELFNKGRVGPIYLDKQEIRDHAVDIRRASAKASRDALSSTRDGRLKVMNEMMKKKDKIKKLNDLGISTNGLSTKEINDLLMDAWVEDEED